MSNEFEAVAHEYRFAGDRWTPCSKADFDKKRLAFMTAAPIEFRELFTGADLRQLAEQRAELLEALKMARAIGEGVSRGYLGRFYRVADAAIANATQQRNATGGEG